MLRMVHRWAGLPAAALAGLVALSGAVLSVFPLFAPAGGARLDAGALAAAVQAALPGVDQIAVAATGKVTATAFGPEGMVRVAVSPASGAILGPVTPGGWEPWLEDLHRALFLGEAGHLAVLAVTAALLALTLSGYALAARRLGGWRRLWSRDHGRGAGGLHLKVARIAGIALVLSSVTGLWMGAATLGLIPEAAPVAPWPQAVAEGPALAPDRIAALTAVPGDSLRALTLPRAGSPGEPWQIETDAGAGFIDPVTGAVLGWADRGTWSQVMDWMQLLHTGQGAAALGLALGLGALAVPALSGTGLALWAAGRRAGRRCRPDDAETAEVVVLVGSEGGSTWGFAEAFARALRIGGHSVHLAPMAEFAPSRYGAARAIVVFAATYGDGDAPASAAGFLDRLAALPEAPRAPLAILGFGDRSFPGFCAYAEAVAAAARARGWALLPEPARVDRRSDADFTAFARDFATATGLAAAGATRAADPRPALRLRLVSRRIHGEEAQAPTAVLRFALPSRTLRQRLTGQGPRFQAGDLLYVSPGGAAPARPYSLASAAADGFAEICVRRQPGGLCSSMLTGLVPGDTVAARIVANPAFHAPAGPEPLILIGAGAGIGALAGIARANRGGRALHLYVGIRSRDGGYPYDAEIRDWCQTGRLATCTLALSRGHRPRYVQDALAEDAGRLADLIGQGARLMVCGGRAMGEGVRAALDDILDPMGLSLATLKAEGRYAEDVF